MPPKSARGRRPTRSSARKSGPQKCTGSPGPAEESLAPPNDVALEVVDTEKPTIQSPALETPSVESPVPENPAGESDEVPKEKDSILVQTDVLLGSSSETLAKEEEVDDSKNNNNNGGGKAKKMVKKTVKVVKKVIKKVPKKVSKVESSGVQVENSAEIPNPSSIISSGVVEEEDVIVKPASSDVQLNVENCDSGVSMPVKMEEEAQNDEKKDGSEEDEKKDGLEGKDEMVEGGLMEQEARMDEKIDGLEGVDEKVEGGLMEVDNNVEEKNGECGSENENSGVGKDVVEGKEENGDGEEGTSHVVKEDEMGEGKLFRGELEAMERRKRRRTEIFIGGLDKDAKEEDIRKVFSEVGEIVDLRVVMNAKTGKNKGFAFLRYASAEDAKKALEKFNKVEICGKQCGATPVEGNDTIFLGNIDKKWKDEDVLKLLQEVGIEQIDKVTVMIDPNKSECNRGFAFVEFHTSKDAQTAHRKLQKNDVFGKNLNIKVAWAEPLKDLDEEEMLKVKTVYAEFIPSSWDEEKVRDTFKNFGEIDDIVLARNLKTTKRKDFAFISYKTREAAIECIESFGREMKDEDGTKVNVKVSLAKPMAKSKKQRPVSKPVAKEVPRKKQKTSHSNLWPSE